MGSCPYHEEKTASFHVDSNKGFYYCFGCGNHGDSIKFISEKLHIPYKDGAIKLAEMINVTVPKDKIGAVIGSGGSTIRSIVDDFGVTAYLLYGFLIIVFLSN